MNTNRTITAEDIIGLDPCYEPEKVRDLVPEPTTLLDLLNLEIPAEDRIWAVTRLIECKRQRVWLAARFVRETPLADGRTVYDLLTDERSIAAVEACELYACGSCSDEELEAAEAAARAAALYASSATQAAAWSAARSARDAAWYAAWHAAAGSAALAAARSASSAADAAASSAADAAAGSAAWSAAEDKQLAIIREALS